MNFQRCGRLAVIFSLVWLCRGVGQAPAAAGALSVVPPKISDLVSESEAILVAKVRSVGVRPDDGRVRALASVVEVWKGAKRETIEYSVTPQWICDITGAEPGETVLLFLAQDKSVGWHIVWAGRGRMPLTNIDGKAYVTFFMDVVLPDGMPFVRNSGTDNVGFGRAVELRILKQRVRELVTRAK